MKKIATKRAYRDITDDKALMAATQPVTLTSLAYGTHGGRTYAPANAVAQHLGLSGAKALPENVRKGKGRY